LKSVLSSAGDDDVIAGGSEFFCYSLSESGGGAGDEHLSFHDEKLFIRGG
jgi:hypothetical protein